MDRRLAWRLALGTLLVMAGNGLAGCAALDLLGGQLLGDEEYPETLVTPQPYPPPKRTVVQQPLSAEPASESTGQTLAPIVSPAQAAQALATTGSQPPAQETLSVPAENTAPTEPQPAAAKADAVQPAPVPDATNASALSTASPGEEPVAESKPAASESAAKKTTVEKAPAKAEADADAKQKPVENELPPADRLADIFRRRDELIAALEAEVKLRTDQPGEEADLLRMQQQLRLLYLLAERPDDAVSEVALLPAAEQEAFKQLMFGLNTWLSPQEDRRTSLRNARVLRSLKDAAGELAAAAKLDVANLRFCESVEGFGWYKEFPTTQFRAKQQVILYAEVDNFATEKKDADTYETELKVSYQIFDPGGTLVDERELPLDKELCRNQRRDYFLAYRIYLPDAIPAGKYRLEVTVEDLKAQDRYQGRKLGTGLIDFSIRQ